jgi:putative Holliday junction resolvase
VRALGVDVGSVRVGIAVSDPDGILATPVETVHRAPPAATGERARPGRRTPPATTGDQARPDLSRIAALVRELRVGQVVVGLPITLAGKEGTAAALARQYAAELARFIDPVPVALSDERMSTVAATRRLSDRGVRGKRQRAVVDQAAAVEILQSWLDAQRRQT